MVVDRVVAVIRRHVLADDEASAWTALGRALAAAARLAGLVLLYSLRFVLAAPETATGLRRMVLDAAPLPGLPAPEEPQPRSPRRRPRRLRSWRCTGLTRTTANRASASKVAAELAPQAGLQAGTARAYLYAELGSRAS